VSDQLSGVVVQAKQYWCRSNESFDDILGVNGLLCNVEDNSDSSGEFSKGLTAKVGTEGATKIFLFWNIFREL
jgi:hypothetical protein